MRAHDRLTLVAVISNVVQSACIDTSGDHPRNDRLSTAVITWLRPPKNQHGQLEIRMAILNSAGSGTSRIGKPNLATLHRFSPILLALSAPPSPTLANWHGAKKAFSNRRPNRPLRPTSTVEKPLSKRCQMAHTFVSDTGRLATKGSIWCSGTHARIPASYNGYKMLDCQTPCRYLPRNTPWDDVQVTDT